LTRTVRGVGRPRRWLLSRFTVLALLVLPFFVTATTPAAALSPAVIIPRSIAPIAAMTPATGIVTAIAGCLFYCDDAYRWGRDAWNDWRNRADVPDVGMTWIQQPNPALGPTDSAGWILGLNPPDMKCQGLSGDPACPNEMQVGIRITHITCQLLNGNLWSPLMGNMYVKVVPENLNQGNSGQLIVNKSMLCPPFTDGSATAVVRVELERVDTYPGAGASATIDWASSVGAPVEATAIATCKDTVNGTVLTMAAPTPVTWDTQTSPAIPSTACPDGFVRSGVEVQGGATWAPPQTIMQRTEDITTIVNNYPDCALSATACKLAPVIDPDTGETVCKWGPYTMPASDCEGLPAPTEPQPTTSPQPSTSPSTAPTLDPAPQIVPRMPTGVPLPSGTPVITREPNPNSTPTAPLPDCHVFTWPSGTVVRNCAAPDGSTVVDYWPPEAPRPGPPTITETLPPPGPQGEAGEDCFGSLITLSNPASWVYGPVVCALKWAFEIKPETQARLSSVGAGIAALPPFSVLTAVPDWLAPIATPGQSCPDWTVQLGPESYSVMCDDPFAQRIHDSRTLFGAAMVAGLLAPFTWRVWHAAIPVLRVQARSGD
jgi:hypothetical protein